MIPELVRWISSFLNYEDYKHFMFTNRENYQELSKNIPYHIKREYAMMQLQEYPDLFFEFFEPVKLYKVPKINLGERMGLTNYIDILTPLDFKITSVSMTRTDRLVLDKSLLEIIYIPF